MSTHTFRESYIKMNNAWKQLCHLSTSFKLEGKLVHVISISHLCNPTDHESLELDQACMELSCCCAQEETTFTI